MAVYAAAVVSFFALFAVTAPYGRHLRPGWGPTISSRLGWVVMESPSVILFAAVYLSGSLRSEPVPLLLMAVWMLHYVRRTLVYPFRLQPASRPMPISIVALGFGFNLVNAFANARWISQLGPYGDGAGGGPWLVIGLTVFIGGWWLNGWADNRLIRLRRTGDDGYRVPNGGAFRWVSCPNYLGEIVEWIGWAVASRSPAALAFAVFTVANLLPRAIAHHRWYRAKFPGYPTDRKALIPYVF
jgi:protein-S-isoprenylcysteine O-methyltransferase Ste14